MPRILARTRLRYTETNHPNDSDEHDMPAIEVRDLQKTYYVYRKREGLMASVRGLFHREYKEVRAVDGVSFTIETGEMVAFLASDRAGFLPGSSTLVDGGMLQAIR